MTIFASVILSELSATNRIGFFENMYTRKNDSFYFTKRSVPFFAVTRLHEFERGQRGSQEE